MSIAVVSLVLSAIVALVAVPVSGRVLGSAARRDDERPGEEAAGLSDEKRPSNEEIKEEAAAIKRTGPFFGALAGVSGVPAGLAGGIFGLGDGLTGSAIPVTSAGVFLGIVGYVLGARGLGRSAAIFSVVALIFAMSVGRGYVPGVQATDRGLPSQEPGSGAGAVEGR